MKFDLAATHWLYPPKTFELGDDLVKIVNLGDGVAPAPRLQNRT